ncbi:MAG: PKD domain-containing protein [Actinobacteria bacterium]|nr:PKD domain-containing protein [Actinomycetota bacterium]
MSLALLALFATTAIAFGVNFASPHLTASPGGEEPTGNLGVDVDSAGDLITMWSAPASSPTTMRAAIKPVGGDFSTLTASSTGQPVSVSTGSVGIDDSGRTYAFFVRSNGANYIAQVAEKPAGGAWGAATNLSAAGADVSTIAGAVNGDGDAIAVWVRGNTYQVSYKPSGGAWEAATSPPGATGTPQGGMHAVINANGDAAAGWDRIPVGTWYSDLVYRPAAGPFAAPNLQLSSNNTDAGQGSLGIDGSGNVSILYRDWPPGSNGLKVKTRAASNGAITTATVVANAAPPSISNPRIAVNESGDAVAVWERVVGADTLIQASQRTGTNGAWSVTPINLTSPGSGASSNPRVAIDGQGNALVTWNNGADISVAFRASGTTSFAPFPNVATGNTPEVVMASQGHGALVYNTSTSPSVVKVAQFDPVAPALAGVTIAATGASGTPLAYAATATDFWDSSPTITWDFGDGQTGTGSGTHTYASGGTFAVTVTATDDAGNSSTQAMSVTITGTPVIGSLKVRPSVFKAARKGASIAASGAVVSYTDTLAAQTTFTVQRPLAGVRKNGKCVAKPRRSTGRKLKSCTRYKSIGSFKRTDVAGANSFRFTGRLESKPLKPGRYRLSAVARNGSSASGAKTVKFRIKR